MLKKIIPISAMALLVITGCSSDSSSSSNGSGEKIGCSVKQTSENSMVMTFFVSNAFTANITTTLNGDKANIEYVTEYSSWVPMEEIANICNENQQEANEKPGESTVICSGRNITIKAVEDAGRNSLEDLILDAKGECESFYKEYSEASTPEDDEEDGDKNEDKNESGSSEQNSSGNSSTNPADNDKGPLFPSSQNNKPSCNVASMADSSFGIDIYGPMGFSSQHMEFAGDTAIITILINYDYSVSQEHIGTTCTELSADPNAIEYESNCDGNLIVAQGSYPRNEFSSREELIAEMREICNEIDRTETVPEYFF